MNKPDINHALVVLSGGQDSTTCLFWALKNYEKVSTITVDYGQRHRRELEAAKHVFYIAGLEIAGFGLDGYLSRRYEVFVPNVLMSTSPLVSDNELEQYDDPESLPGGLEKTFVPMRNQFFLTLAFNHAIAIGAGTLVTGVCQEDYGGYPDCRQDFIDKLLDATLAGLGLEEGALSIQTPLMDLSKAQSIYLASEVGAMTALAFSHTSYDGQYPPTGKDHATLLREKGFTEAGLPDPLIVRAVDEGLMEKPDRPGYDYTDYGNHLLGNIREVRASLGADFIV